MKENYIAPSDNKRSALHESLHRKNKCPNVLLLISDDKSYILKIEPVLNRAGFNVMVAATERDAFSIISCSMPTVILVDSSVDGTVGNVLVQRLKKLPYLGKIPIYLSRQSKTKYEPDRNVTML